MKAYLKNYRQSPRKVRLAGELMKGKSVTRVERELSFLGKRAGGTLKKLLSSAVANAKENNGVNKNDLYVKNVRVDEGPTLKRIRPRARGSAFLIRKRTSNISLELGQKVKSQKSVKSKDKKKLTAKS